MARFEGKKETKRPTRTWRIENLEMLEQRSVKDESRKSKNIKSDRGRMVSLLPAFRGKNMVDFFPPALHCIAYAGSGWNGYIAKLLCDLN